jgi:mannose-6-phosphate isomerase-like protein (cupin superfamily)
VSEPGTYATRMRGRVLAPPGSKLVIAEWEADGAVDGERLYQAPLHRHVDEDEAWYVLEGTLAVRIGDDEIEVPAGGAAIVPAGTAHTYWNPRPEPARYLLIMGADTNALIANLHTVAPGSGPEVWREHFARFGAELLD